MVLWLAEKNFSNLGRLDVPSAIPPKGITELHFMKQKKYKDSFCRPIVTNEGTKLAGGAARNYRIGQFEDGLDEIIAEAIQSVHERLFDRMTEKHTSRRILRTPPAPSAGLPN
ncbi:hypothetical protein [Burkholderia sp. WTPI3]|nr:hypothetical protein [Burkholderia sp. WTPI3]